MHVKNRGMAWATLAAIALLSACGPVKFSSSSEAGLDPSGITPTPTPDGGDPTPTPTPTPSGTPTPTPTPTLRTVTGTKTVADKDYKLDIVLVIDDSNSMLADNQKLANRLSGLVTKLDAANIDWQMCATVTRWIPVSTAVKPDGKAWGASYYWQRPATSPSASPDKSIGMVLKKGTADVGTVFTNTINYIYAGWADSNDERGIKAAYSHVYNGDLRYTNNGCYRADSAVTYIIISDEDERSIGGDASQQVYQGELLPLENEDQPQVFVDFFKSTFGATRRFTVNSIIVKPGDSTCKAEQDAQGAKSHYGFKYSELSGLTGGGVGSICATDYTTNMDLFFGKISESLSSLPLECAPYNDAVSVTFNPTSAARTSTVSGSSLVFSSPVPSGTTITVSYQCIDRGVASMGQPTVLEQPGFFARIVNFFKNLF